MLKLNHLYSLTTRAETFKYQQKNDSLKHYEDNITLHAQQVKIKNKIRLTTSSLEVFTKKFII